MKALKNGTIAETPLLPMTAILTCKVARTVNLQGEVGRAVQENSSIHAGHCI